MLISHLYSYRYRYHILPYTPCLSRMLRCWKYLSLQHTSFFNNFHTTVMARRHHSDNKIDHWMISCDLQLKQQVYNRPLCHCREKAEVKWAANLCFTFHTSPQKNTFLWLWVTPKQVRQHTKKALHSLHLTGGCASWWHTLHVSVAVHSPSSVACMNRLWKILHLGNSCCFTCLQCDIVGWGSCADSITYINPVLSIMIFSLMKCHSKLHTLTCNSNWWMPKWNWSD